MKRYIGVFALVLAFLCVCFLCIVMNDRDCIDHVKLVSSVDGQTTKISLHENNGRYYAFLPSHFELENATLEYTNGCSLLIDGKEYTSETPCTDLQTQTEYTVVIENSFGFTASENTLVIYKAENTASLFIDLTDGVIDDINSDKETEKTGKILAIDADNTISYNGDFDKIHGRGNGTWYASKKPYNISFKNDVDLLGMGLGTDWILLSNPFDSSSLRNKIVYDFADELGLHGTPASRFVDLYIDGEYRGLYLLTEKVEIEPTRVDVTDMYENTQLLNSAPLYTYPTVQTEVDGVFKKGYSIPVIPNDVTGGYLLELQIYSYRNTFTSAFTTDDSVCFSFQSMPYVSWEQIEYISSFIQDVEDSFHNGNYEQYIDVDSWVNYYLVQEIFGNTDVRSFFYYKNSDLIDGKLYAGPVWDFDVALGIATDDAATKAFCVNTWGWFSLLYQHESFKNSVAEQYEQTLKPMLTELTERALSDYQQQIEQSFVMDRERWTKGTYKSLENHVQQIGSYLTERIEFLDEVWVEGKEVYTITATSKPAEAISSVKYYYSVPVGEQMPQFSTPTVSGYKFLGWFDTQTGEEYDPTEIPTCNRNFEAKWEAVPRSDEPTQSLTLMQRVYNLVMSNLELIVIVALFGVIAIFVLLYVCIDYRRRRKEGADVRDE